MAQAATYLNWFVRLCGLILIVLGILFWTGNALVLVNLHMIVGILLVLALWAVAVLAAISRVQIGLVVIGFLWGLLVAWLGMAQLTMLPGTMHWIVQVLHLLIGLAAIGLAQQLASSIAPTKSAA